MSPGDRSHGYNNTEYDFADLGVPGPDGVTGKWMWVLTL
jgi:hypothetical protein